MDKKLSIIIPSYRDPLLQKTIDSILENSEGEIEVIPVLDGYQQDVKKDSRVKVISLKRNKGTRGAINAGLKIAKGEFVAKLDSHCMVAQGFDRIMCENCEENWVSIPRRYSLDEINWERNESRWARDYCFLSFPVESKYGYGMFAQDDWTKNHHFRNNPKHNLDNLMTFQASCWFVNRKYFMEHVGLLDDRVETYGPFGGEYLEIGLKYWLGGGAVKVNKKTWYAHLSKRQYHYDKKIYTQSYKQRATLNRNWSTKHWVNNEEPNMVHDFRWFIEKFWPILSWPENWQEILNGYNL